MRSNRGPIKAHVFIGVSGRTRMAMGRAQTEEGKNQNLQAAGWVDCIDVECEKTAFARKSL